ncbi:hypothetical protein HYW83_01375 [Candidatus Peregrinibacteria bacterium]|nr:hypothetical protein [Candidatus Peregrinibacteria bacterium]
MDSKKLLIAVAILVTVANVSFTLAANEPLRNVYSGFGIEDPDADLDGIDGNADKCPGTPFDILIFNKNTKKQKVVTDYPSSSDPSKKVYIRLKKVNDKEKDGDNNVVFQTSPSEKFSKKGLEEYTLAPNKIAVIKSIGKQFRVLYSHSGKGIAVVWTAGLVDKKGCSADE